MVQPVAVRIFIQNVSLNLIVRFYYWMKFEPVFYVQQQQDTTLCDFVQPCVAHVNLCSRSHRRGSETLFQGKI